MGNVSEIIDDLKLLFIPGSLLVAFIAFRMYFMKDRSDDDE